MKRPSHQIMVGNLPIIPLQRIHGHLLAERSPQAGRVWIHYQDSEKGMVAESFTRAEILQALSEAQTPPAKLKALLEAAQGMWRMRGPALVALCSNPSVDLMEAAQQAGSYIARTATHRVRTHFACIWAILENPALPLLFLENPAEAPVFYFAVDAARGRLAMNKATPRRWRWVFAQLAQQALPWLEEHWGPKRRRTAERMIARLARARSAPAWPVRGLLSGVMTRNRFYDLAERLEHAFEKAHSERTHSIAEGLGMLAKHVIETSSRERIDALRVWGACYAECCEQSILAVPS